MESLERDRITGLEKRVAELERLVKTLRMALEDTAHTVEELADTDCDGVQLLFGE